MAGRHPYKVEYVGSTPTAPTKNKIGAVMFFKPKCCFCKINDGYLHSVCKHGIYGDVGKRIFYHPECLEQVQLYPEKFNNIIVDKAIFISDHKDKCIKINKRIINEHERKIERLKADHFLSMIPR